MAVALLVIAGCAGPTQDGSTTTSEGGGLLGRATTVELTVPAGTVLAVRMDRALSSETSQPGERFQARVVSPVMVDGRTAIPSGSTVSGRVADVVPTKKFGGTARLGVEFDRIDLAHGGDVAIAASYAEQGKSQVKKDTATIGGATAGGAVLGRIVGHQSDNDARGTAVGAVVGGAVGTAVAAKNKRDPVVIPAQSVLHVQLAAPVRIEVRG